MTAARTPYELAPDLVLGTHIRERVPEADQRRQRAEVAEILRRLAQCPGVVLADEVGMGKTFVALAVAHCVSSGSPRGPVIVMVPANLVGKWEQDLRTFCELYLEGRHPLRKETATPAQLADPAAVRYGVAYHSIELLKLLDDPARSRCRLVFLAQGAMSRRQSDKWVRLALIAEALRRHACGKAARLIQVRRQIHRFAGELLWAVGEQRGHAMGAALWQQLLHNDPSVWMSLYNGALRREDHRLTDDPVPKAVARVLGTLDLRPLAGALKQMPVRATADRARLRKRVEVARVALRGVEAALWKDMLAQARWRSPLLIMDEAHHLKNPGTALARQLQSPDTEQDLRTGDGAMAGTFDRMLFLTATPFQLGHRELVSVLRRFGDIRWDRTSLGDQAEFHDSLDRLSDRLDDSQRAAVALRRAWSRLGPDDVDDADPETWWSGVRAASRDARTTRQQAIVDAYDTALRGRDGAEAALRPWIVRHNKGTHWPDTAIPRRMRFAGAATADAAASGGLAVPPQQLLPFFLAARSVTRPGHDLLGEALCSSYEAFRFTRENRRAGKDEQSAEPDRVSDLACDAWYLREFDLALASSSGAVHPKMAATVRRVVDLWEAGEKVLVFAFYRRTCRALRIHISDEIERRLMLVAKRRLGATGVGAEPDATALVERIQNRFFDDADGPGRRAIDAALADILDARRATLAAAHFTEEERQELTEVMRRFLRVPTTLVRCFPLAELDDLPPAESVQRLLADPDSSGVSWRDKFGEFMSFLADACATDERALYLEAARRTQTGGIRVEDIEDDDPESETSTVTLANVQVATGVTRRETRARLMRAFNTPFFPDILVCSEVMGEGVDLQRFCRHVIHHDLAWNPSDIEQRTGRIDRLGCKAEGRHPIVVDLPYLAGAADERQYRVMTDREQWFRVVMGQDEVARLITADADVSQPFPESAAQDLAYRLAVDAF